MWTSPDGKLEKVVTLAGKWGTKPSETSVCTIKITETAHAALLNFNNSKLVVGISDSYLKRTLDLCVITMNEGEVAQFTILADNLKFTLQLVSFRFNGLIYEWNVERKLVLTHKYKLKGIDLFKLGEYKDSAYCFIKALKIVLSIPLDAQDPPEAVEGFLVKEISNLKATLYNDLASFYLKFCAWDMIIDLCKKVFLYQPEHVKAHYKLGVAYMNDRNFDLAKTEFDYVIGKEPSNKAVKRYLRYVNEQIDVATVNTNLMYKKMFA